MLKLPFSKRPPIDEFERTAQALVAAMRHEMRGGNWWGGSGLRQTEAAHPQLFGQILDIEGTDRGGMALALVRVAKSIPRQGFGHREDTIQEDLLVLADRLASPRGALEAALYPELVECWVTASLYDVGYARLVRIAESIFVAHGLSPELETGLRSLRARLEDENPWGGTPTADQRRQAMRIRQILDPAGAAALRLSEPWQLAFRDPVWSPLLDHAATAKGTAPSEKWTKTANSLLGPADLDAFLDAFETSVKAVGAMAIPVDAVHSDMLRGLAWTAGLTESPRAAARLGRLAVACAHKIPNYGARSPKGFSGAVGALERMGTFAALAELSNARNRVKAPSLSAALAAALNRAAQAQKLSVEELEELVVPTYDLTLPGVRREAQDDVEATLEIVGATDVDLRWSRGGKALKSAPTEAKPLDKALKATKKEIEATLAAQRARLEGLMLSGRTLPYPAWRERYLDHPLLAFMARRLVWRFADEGGERLGIAPDGVPIDGEGRPLEGLGEETAVRLWHPIQAGAAAIEAWRDALVAREIRQPFKQAYREIYLLTAAEERTNTYSNRFAAHVLKQHQMAALARARGWRYALQGGFDGGNSPTLDLPQWGLQAEYSVDIAEMGAMPEGGMTETGIALYVVTDQVRLADRDSRRAVPLAEVPPVVFSEVMRDVDLFVGVASVGNDASWADQGERTGYGAYWREVSFGDLSATAETRKAVLERLLPRLAVGKSARLDGRFLVVKGKRRTYKIHLGSGNILMEPNDQYLCIVPGSAKGTDAGRVYLPFEGDGVLAIILSKATMLAADDRITDPTILRQL